MTIGADIKEILKELGTSVTINRYDGTTVTGEYVDHDNYPEHSTEFIRQFFITATFAHDTVINSGDYLEFIVSGKFYLVTSKSPQLFENAVNSFIGACYLCNTTGTIQRYSEGARDAQYRLSPSWSNISANVRGLMVDNPYENEINEEHNFEFLETHNFLYISGNYDIQKGDRFYISSTEYYKVDYIESKRLSNVHIVFLGVDTRE